MQPIQSALIVNEIEKNNLLNQLPTVLVNIVSEYLTGDVQKKIKNWMELTREDPVELKFLDNIHPSISIFNNNIIIGILVSNKQDYCFCTNTSVNYHEFVVNLARDNLLSYEISRLVVKINKLDITKTESSKVDKKNLLFTNNDLLEKLISMEGLWSIFELVFSPHFIFNKIVSIPETEPMLLG